MNINEYKLLSFKERKHVDQLIEKEDSEKKAIYLIFNKQDQTINYIGSGDRLSSTIKEQLFDIGNKATLRNNYKESIDKNNFILKRDYNKSFRRFLDESILITLTSDDTDKGYLDKYQNEIKSFLIYSFYPVYNKKNKIYPIKEYLLKEIRNYFFKDRNIRLLDYISSENKKLIDYLIHYALDNIITIKNNF